MGQTPSFAPTLTIIEALLSKDPRVKLLCLVGAAGAATAADISPTWNMSTCITKWEGVKVLLKTSSPSDDNSNSHVSSNNNNNVSVVEIVIRRVRRTDSAGVAALSLLSFSSSSRSSPLTPAEQQHLQQRRNEAFSRFKDLFPQLQSLILENHSLNGNVTELLRNLPPNLKHLNLCHGGGGGGGGPGASDNNSSGSDDALCGTLDTSSLPASLVTINLSGNRFSGSIDWRGFSRLVNLQSLVLSSNRFSSNVQLEYLSRQNLREVALAHNHFSAPVNISHVPRGVEKLRLQQMISPLDLSQVRYVGTVGQLPQGLDADSVRCLGFIQVGILAPSQSSSSSSNNNNSFHLDSGRRNSHQQQPQRIELVSGTVFHARSKEFHLFAGRDDRGTLLSLFASATDGKPHSWSCEYELQKWAGIICGQETGRIEQLSVPNNRMTGSLPANMMVCVGTLPHIIFCSLKVLNLQGHLLTGNVAILSQLPATLEVLDLSRAVTAAASSSSSLSSTSSGSRAGLSGTLPLSAALPKNLRVFNIANNAFSGEVRLGELFPARSAVPPSVLETFNIAGNSFSGIFDFSKLPASALTSLNVTGNVDLCVVGDLSSPFPLRLDGASRDLLSAVAVQVSGVSLRGNEFLAKVQQRVLEAALTAGQHRSLAYAVVAAPVAELVASAAPHPAPVLVPACESTSNGNQQQQHQQQQQQHHLFDALRNENSELRRRNDLLQQQREAMRVERDVALLQLSDMKTLLARLCSSKG